MMNGIILIIMIIIIEIMVRITIIKKYLK